MPSVPDMLKSALDAHRASDVARAETGYREVLRLEPDNPAALHYLGLIEGDRRNTDEAAALIRRSLAIKPQQPAAQNNLGNILGTADRIEEAISAFTAAVELKPDYALAWQNLARMLQRGGHVSESIAASERQLALQPENSTALWNVELCRRELGAADPSRAPAPKPEDGKWLSIGVTCYGDYPQYTLRCIDSLCSTPSLLDRADLYVGCNTVTPRVRDPIRAHFDAGRITTFIESNRNWNKSPMVRQFLNLTRTPYLLVVDDDSHVKPGWLDAIERFIERHHPFDLAGSIYEIDRTPEFMKLVEAKPWWRGVGVGHRAYRDKIHLAAGGMYLARAAFLRKWDYPDRSMIIWREDAMLSDLVDQVGGRQVRFTKDVMDHVKVNDAERRGEDIFTVRAYETE